VSFLQVQSSFEEIMARPRSSRRVNFGIGRGEFRVHHRPFPAAARPTILNILAGLDSRPPKGLWSSWTNREVRGSLASSAAWVFQGHALMPWLSVMSNHRVRGERGRWPQWKPDPQVQVHCQKFHRPGSASPGAEHKKPAELSGRQLKQRVGHRPWPSRSSREDAAARRAVRRARRPHARRHPRTSLLRICAGTRQTVFMIHARFVDESIPGSPTGSCLIVETARMAWLLPRSSGETPCCRSRASRLTIHHDPQYLPDLRNHPGGFSREPLEALTRAAKRRRPPRLNPPLVRPGLEIRAARRPTLFSLRH